MNNIDAFMGMNEMGSFDGSRLFGKSHGCFVVDNRGRGEAFGHNLSLKP